MILSVVIVNYNVKFFLEQCLSSLKKAIESTDFLRYSTEVFVIDNASTDDSLPFLERIFPQFVFIGNKENIGFSKANNQALTRCKGEFVLFLNPDTILDENALRISVSFLSENIIAGATGVHMIDGTGRFLKESKRGFPSYRVSFFKMIGLATIFPKSKYFAAYYAGHLDEHSTTEVDILSGAFMMVRKSILDKIGGFDEMFFMYGEDIDLSYRIQQLGFKNYYLPSAKIIHFKGESTKKNFRYTKMFYEAMDKFIHKHFNKKISFARFPIYAGVRLHHFLNNIKILFRKRNKKVFANPEFIKCASDRKKYLTTLFGISEIAKTRNQKASGTTIFCESSRYTWSQIINEIQSYTNGAGYMFHGENTHAAVGSNSAQGQGDIIEI